MWQRLWRLAEELRRRPARRCLHSLRRPEELLVVCIASEGHHTVGAVGLRHGCVVVNIRDFFVRSYLSSYYFFDSNSAESQKSTPDHIDDYAAYETCGK